MPLLIQNKRVDRISSSDDLYGRYPHLQENARQFRSRPLVDVDPKCFLYVQQREYAATTPEDKYVSILGSDDATTCHLVVLQHTGSRAVCVAHLDGFSTYSEVQLIIKAVMSLSHHSKDGRLELHLVGGFNDDSKISHTLSRSILDAFQKQNESVHLETCCITEMNDTVANGTHRPVVYGVGVNVKTGEVFPSSFACKGPAEELRSARTFTGGPMAEVYDSVRGMVQIGPCKWTPHPEIAEWLEQNDAKILQNWSTSPEAEPPHFVQHMKSTFQFLLDHPNTDDLFPNEKPQRFHRTDQGEWERNT